MDGLVLMQLLKTDFLTVNMYKIAPTLIKIRNRIEYLTHFVLFYKTPTCHPGTLASLNVQEITVHQIGVVQHSQKHNQISYPYYHTQMCHRWMFCFDQGIKRGNQVKHEGWFIVPLDLVRLFSVICTNYCCRILLCMSRQKKATQMNTRFTILFGGLSNKKTRKVQ